MTSYAKLATNTDVDTTTQETISDQKAANPIKAPPPAYTQDPPQAAYPGQVYTLQGYLPQGYQPKGYPPQGYPPQDYPAEGYTYKQ